MTELRATAVRHPPQKASNFTGKTMVTLIVNGKYLAQRTTGVQRYAAEIVRAWDAALDEGWIDRDRYQIHVIAPRTVREVPAYKNVKVTRGLTGGRLWEQIELPWRSRGKLLFSPYAAAPIAKLRHAVTIHDAGVRATPQQYSRAFRAFYSPLFWILGKTCRPIFTVSEFSRQELHRFFSIPIEKISVVFPGCDHILNLPSDQAILARAGLECGRYVLGVSSQSVIKNFAGLAQAWKMLGRTDFKLAVAGGINKRLFTTGGEPSDDSVVRLGYVTDAELRALYEGAALFVFPSFYEGFGIPPVEAMACGCPALVANESALPEICGHAAAYCNPSDVSDIAESISRVLNDPALARQMRRKGIARAELFKVRAAASMIWSELVKHM